MEKLETFHKTRQGYIVFGGIELVLVYILASIAIDTANMFAYAFTIILSVGMLNNFYNAIKWRDKKAKK